MLHSIILLPLTLFALTVFVSLKAVVFKKIKSLKCHEILNIAYGNSLIGHNQHYHSCSLMILINYAMK